MTSQEKTKTFIAKFNLLYDGGIAVAHKYSNEVDKLISADLDIDY